MLTQTQWTEFVERSGVPESVWREMFPALRPIDVPAGFRLDHTGTRSGHVIFIVEGQAVVRSVTCLGREMVLYRCFPGSASLLPLEFPDPEPGYVVEAVAETPLVGLRASPAAVREAMTRSEQFSRYLVAMMARRLSGMIDRAHDMTFRGVRDRVRAFLSRAAAEVPDGRICITHQQLACEVGSTREVVSRTLRELEAEGELVLGRACIQVKARAESVH